ncbi:PREDICTED: uncharacterized protein LOC106751270 [Dinoponera quadriceps]|uniref:Uncharacterized protein LOC106751270 n=1 Tax=Dinoponera quadriceps TaxID=609295 RepID=A0A6P3YB88_DINQU|nr:PREDICTED: uncharacterized protein LOC106751270 [Dinoponera quadriceps]
MLQMDAEEHLFGGEPSDSDDADYEVMEESDETSSDSFLHIDPEDLQEGVRSERATSSGARGRPRSKLRGKNNYAWSTNLPVRTSDRFIPPEEIIIPQPIGAASALTNIEDFCNLLFDDSILNTIVDSTNKIIEDLIVQRIADERSVETEHHRLDLNEFKAFLAILYHMALWKSSNVDDNMLWSSENEKLQNPFMELDELLYVITGSPQYL